MLSMQSRTANNGRSSSCGIGMGLTTSRCRTACYELLHTVSAIVDYIRRMMTRRV